MANELTDINRVSDVARQSYEVDSCRSETSNMPASPTMYTDVVGPTDEDPSDSGYSLLMPNLVSGAASNNLCSHYDCLNEDTGISYNAANTSVTDKHVSSNVINLEDLSTKISDNFEHNKSLDLRHFLRKWSIENDIKISAVSSLLKGLSETCCSNCCSSLPLDGRTLIETNRKIKMQIQSKAGGHYVHIGILKGIKSHVMGTTDNSHKLIAIINIDGVPIFKSSGLSFWPILMRIANGNYDQPFVVGIFSGTAKSNNIEEFLSEFVSDMVSVIDSGVTLDNQHFEVSLKCLIMNAPALAMIKCIKLHCGYYSCPRCIQAGTRVDYCTVFLQTDAPLRTDEAFRNYLYGDYGDHQSGVSPLLPLPIDMVLDMPFDYMHLVC